MLMSEFVDRTGFVPTDDEFAAIETAYYESAHDKDIYCRNFLETGGINRHAASRLDEISKLNDKLKETEAELAQVSFALGKKVEELTKALDKELNWQPCENAGTHFDEERYQKLYNCRDTEVFTDDKAKEFIHRYFGFDPLLVKIIDTVDTYEVNKYHRLRIKATYERRPLYNASDWNYIRFDCAGWSYEIINDTLVTYDS